MFVKMQLVKNNMKSLNQLILGYCWGKGIVFKTKVGELSIKVEEFPNPNKSITPTSGQIPWIKRC